MNLLMSILAALAAAGVILAVSSAVLLGEFSAQPRPHATIAEISFFSTAQTPRDTDPRRAAAELAPPTCSLALN